MPGWKEISDDAAKKREAAFEAQMLASLAKEAPSPPAVPTRDGIQITVTANGHTIRYDNLASVPAHLRHQILNAWQPAPPPIVAPALPAASAPRQPSRRVATGLNLFLPGAGQFYLGKPVAGSVFALTFLACFGAMLVIFVRGYVQYLQLSTSGDIMATGNLEQLSNAFPIPVLIGLLVVATGIYVASAIHLSRCK